jgi:hypothetical protein
MNTLNITKQKSYSKVEPLSDLPVVGKLPLPEIIREKSRAYLDKGETNKQTIISKRERKPLSERLNVRYETKAKLIRLLSELGQKELSEKLSQCGQKFAVLTCGEHIVSKTAYHRCDLRFCPICAYRRSNRYVNKYLPFASEFLKHSSVPVTACHLVLTQQHRPGETLKNSRQRLLDAFKDLTRREFWKQHFAGGIWAIENTISKDGCNHTHLHLLTFRKRFVDVDEFRHQWEAVTGGAKNLHIKRVDSLDGALKEVIKYVSKPIDVRTFGKSHVRELLQIKGKRMLDCFGEFRKFCQTHKLPEQEIIREKSRLVEGDCCPKCNDANNKIFELTMTEKQLIAFHRRVEQTRGSPPLINH